MLGRAVTLGLVGLVVALGPGRCDVSTAQAAGVPNIDNRV